MSSPPSEPQPFTLLVTDSDSGDRIVFRDELPSPAAAPTARVAPPPPYHASRDAFGRASTEKKPRLRQTWRTAAQVKDDDVRETSTSTRKERSFGSGVILGEDATRKAKPVLARKVVALLLGLLLFFYAVPVTNVFRTTLSKTFRRKSQGISNIAKAPDFSHLAAHCAHLEPLPASSVLRRQSILAEALLNLGGAAYVVEPGPNALYYANVTNGDGGWSLTERPLLFVFTPVGGATVGRENSTTSEVSGVAAKLSIITPSFELARAKLLPLPNDLDSITFVEWEEGGDPFRATLEAIGAALEDGYVGDKVFVDEEARNFVSHGLEQAAKGMNVKDEGSGSVTTTKREPDLGVSAIPPFKEEAPSSVSLAEPHGQEVMARRFDVLFVDDKIRLLRERKTKEEIGLMRCAEEVTLLAVRSVRSHLHVGMRESEAKELTRQALTAAGLKDLELLVMFGENAALPHGSGTDKILRAEDLILIDCGGSLHGYNSDLTRTFALPESERIPAEHLHIWDTVRAAQNAALSVSVEGAAAGEIDRAAREVIRSAGYGEYFTHRLGHGIGLQVHEVPYLVKGSPYKLVTGNTLSNEPGVYMLGKVGIRLEDTWVLDPADGKGHLLTEGVGGAARSPWHP